jgi:hypothetical protein
MITVMIQGHGTYVVPQNKLDELLSWLNNNSMPSEGVATDTDETLLNG